ncbi:MAG: cryptochrome/photolyase family protein [Pseudomonadota bacterium]
MRCRRLVLILGDQLTPEIAALRSAEQARDRVLMVEVMEEATYVRHHKKKIALVLSAMRHFTAELRSAGWRVDYVQLEDPDNSGSFTGEIGRAIDWLQPERIVVTEPGEWRLRQMMETWSARFGLPVDILDDERFLCTRQAFSSWAAGRRQLTMEFFYRDMRRKTGLLMDGARPEGGRWNFDRDNRKAATPGVTLPQPKRFEPDAVTRKVLDLVGERFDGHFGDLAPFWFAVTRAQAEAALDRFMDDALPGFGDYQDAMLAGERFLFHSVLSAYINLGLLDPLAVCRRVESAYKSGRVPLNAAEGFIRQIIGWREYVRGIYWLAMPDYLERNTFGAARPLPGFYWTGETDMACLRAAITQTKEEAYAHHIQRLMVTGNFAMLAGVDPKQVHEWYLAVYADAYEWVELPNTLGMSQFADGGLLGSKPYAASGNYIHKMSDHCRDCAYDVKKKTGAGACPFNPLYWDFMARNGDRLRGNRRLAQAYSVWDRMDEAKRAAYRKSAQDILKAL